MCGIFCAFKKGDKDNSLSCIYESCRNNLARRGPDAQNKVEVTTSNHTLLISGSVLWLQGQQITKQPFQKGTSTLAYNGDVFGGDLDAKDRAEFGDTSLLFERLENSSKVSIALSIIAGPYAFVYLCTKRNMLYFGRDLYGRRSLLIGIDKKSNTYVLTSVAVKSNSYDFIELPAIGTFSYNLSTSEVKLYPWRCKNDNFSKKLNELAEFVGVNNIEIAQQLPDLEYHPFSDPTDYDIDFLNSLKSLDFDNAMNYLLSNAEWMQKVIRLRSLLENAISERIKTQPKYCQSCIKTKEACCHALTGVLFSGGLDCAILTLLADKFIDKDRPIDLFNVSFDANKNYLSPDRVTGIETFEELKVLRPERRWNFVEINVTKEELNFERDRTIRHLIYPLNTVLDDSLGCALWFASRGISENYKSSCRVLLVGMGADELFGGYTRHRNALKRRGWLGLHESLQEDWQNISYRNLGRDDRVVSDHGRQLRTPYLDEEFVEYVRNLQAWEKTYPSNEVPVGFGEKILLRSLAYYLGLKKASSFKKRALQFGSRIANSKENGQDVSLRL